MAPPPESIPESSSDRDPDGSDYDSDPNGYLEMEALEDEIEEGDSIDRSDEYDDGKQAPSYSFTPFLRLPVELRRRVWESFCPDLEAKTSRLFQFKVMPDLFDPTGTSTHWALCADGILLEQQTLAIRTVLAVHHESRALVLGVLPDTLEFIPYQHKERRAGAPPVKYSPAHFDAESDVVVLHGLLTRPASPLEFPSCPNVKHLALQSHSSLSLGFDAMLLQRSFPRLETLLYVIDSEDCKMRALAWCGSDEVNRHMMVKTEEEIGLMEDIEIRHIWPDFRRHRSFAEKIRIENLGTMARYKRVWDEVKALKWPGEPDRSVFVGPLVEFLGEEQDYRYTTLEMSCDLAKEKGIDPVELYDSTSDEDESSIGEYESEGIDDEEVDFHFEEYDDVTSLGTDDLDDDPFEEFEPVPGQDFIDPGWSDEEEAAEAEGRARYFPPVNLAALELAVFLRREAATAARVSGLVEPDAGEPSDGPSGGPVARRAKRRVVSSDSDEEAGEEDEEEQDEEVRPTKKARIAVRGRRAALADSDEEEDEAEPGGNSAPPGRASAQKPKLDDEDEDGEDDPPPRPLTLAEKLQLNRQNNPIPVSSDDDEDHDSQGSDEEKDDDDGEEYDDDNDGDEIS